MAETPPPSAEEPDPAPYLDAEPPHWAARGVAYVLIALFVGAVIASVVVHLPETVTSPFLLVPVRGADPVRAARGGTVTEARVIEAASVSRGQTLFIIRSAAAGDQSAELRTLEAQVEGATQGLANAESRHASQRLADEQEVRRLGERRDHLGQRIESHRTVRAIRLTRYEASLRIAETEVESARSEIAFRKEHLALARELAERHRKGYEQGFLSWIEYIRPQIEASKLAVDLEQLERALGVAQLKVGQLRSEHEREEVDWKLTLEQLQAEAREARASLDKLRHESTARRAEHAELTRRLREDAGKATIRIAALQEALVQTRGNQLSVSAPCAGTVLRLLVRGPGAVVQEGEVLGELACAEERLQAELQVPPAGMGRIKPGDPVKLLYDAFPYERYGVRYGTVRWVSPASATAREGSPFRALADVTDEAIVVDGQPRPLVAGMGGRANVVVGRRSLLSYAFEPLRQLKENFAGAPAK